VTELVVRNKEILNKLEYVRSSVFNSRVVTDPQFVEDGKVFNPPDAKTNPGKYLTEEYLFRNMADPNHQGFPVEHCSYPIEHAMAKDSSLRDVNEYSRSQFITELGANHNAVFLYYPPGGFVGWHNNANNSGIQFIFTYSEGGDGYFQYYDKQKQEIVVTHDSPGWRCHYHYFGATPDDHCWHSAYTNEPRITVCVLFRWWDKPELEQQIRDMAMDLAEEIQED
jgi:hypothetical protein